MLRSMLKKTVVIGLALGAMGGPTSAYAQSNTWVEPFNDGNGTCGYQSCNSYGCTPFIIFPCPREVSGE
jgi:hypothetical protein